MPLRGTLLNTATVIVGPWGIDAQVDGANAAFALYDTHGNAKALLSRSGGSFTTADWRHYDVWGSLRSGLTSGGASQRYCANLGHVTDDESGLVYMRARFYEPWTGRFVSEDPAFADINLYRYAANSPLVFVDPSGGFNIEIGGLYWIRFDKNYTQEGTGNIIQDLTWGTKKGGQYTQLGSIRPDGTIKHGVAMTDTVKDLVRENVKVMTKIAKGAGRYGLCATVITTSLDAAFLSDPLAFGDMIDYVGGDWSLLGGWVDVSSS